MNTRSIQGRFLAVALCIVLGAMFVLPAMAGGADSGRRAASSGARGQVPETITDYRERYGDPQPNPGVNALADDSFPGDDLYLRSDSAMPAVVDTLDTAGDATDIFYFYAAPGEDIMLFVEPDAALGVSMELYRGSGALPVTLGVGFGGGLAVGDVAWLDYTVPESYAPGFYYIEVHAETGSGPYELWWSINSKSDGNVPGVPIPDSPFTDTVDTDYDQDDVFAIHLGAGETLDVTVTGSGADIFDAFLLEPGTLDIWNPSSVASENDVNVATLTYTPGPGEEGVYYLDIWADAEQNVEYTVDWSVTGVNAPGTLLASSPVSGILGVTPRVFYVDLTYGQKIDLAISSAGAVDVELFGPDEVDVVSGTPLSGLSYTVPYNGAGRYYVALDAALPATNYTLTYTITDAVERISGNDRYETSAKISQMNFPDGADVVVIATGASFPDALAASSLAGVYDAPVLLTDPTTLKSVTSAEIARLGATRCYIVGGTSAVSAGVASSIDAISGMTIPVRVSGNDRYSTAAAVAETVLWRHGYRLTPVALMARGDDYADALSLSPVAWAMGFPIVLTQPTSLPASTRSFLTEMPIVSVGVGGGPGAISDDVLAAVGTVPSIASVARLTYGANRYETSAALAEWGATSPWLSWAHSGVATGENFPDALSGGSGIAKSGGVMLLTGSASLNSNARTMLTTYAAEIETAELFGGTAALSSSVMTSVKRIVQ